MTDKPVYVIGWSDEDGEYFAVATGYPSLSWLDPDPVKALDGLKKLIDEFNELTGLVGIKPEGK